MKPYVCRLCILAAAFAVLATYVACCGPAQAPIIARPLAPPPPTAQQRAAATDFPSIKGNGDGTFPPNYVGEYRRMLVVDAGLTTQALVNWCCQCIYQRVRALRPTASAVGTFVSGVLEGDIVTVEGLGYWRITALRTEWTRQYVNGLTTYELEFVPDGEVTS